MSDYPIGYRKPPIQTRFKKGQSGNPRGRPRGTRDPLATINKIFGRKFKINEGGVPRTIEAFELIMLRLVEQASKGNHNAIRLCLDIQRWVMGFADQNPNNGQKIKISWVEPQAKKEEDLSCLTDDEVRALKFRGCSS